MSSRGLAFAGGLFALALGPASTPVWRPRPWSWSPIRISPTSRRCRRRPDRLGRAVAGGHGAVDRLPLRDRPPAQGVYARQLDRRPRPGRRPRRRHRLEDLGRARASRRRPRPPLPQAAARRRLRRPHFMLGAFHEVKSDGRTVALRDLSQADELRLARTSRPRRPPTGRATSSASPAGSPTAPPASTAPPTTSRPLGAGPQLDPPALHLLLGRRREPPLVLLRQRRPRHLTPTPPASRGSPAAASPSTRTPSPPGTTPTHQDRLRLRRYDERHRRTQGLRRRQHHPLQRPQRRGRPAYICTKGGLVAISGPWYDLSTTGRFNGRQYLVI